MKVRIVKCHKPDEWYVDKIGDILTVRDATFNFYAYDGKLRILKEDCEILEADEPKPEPFDLGRALNGEPFLLKGNGTHLRYIVGKSKFGYQSDHGVKYYVESNQPQYPSPIVQSHNEDELRINYEMAPREPEYQTVWVNLYEAGCAAYELTKNEAMEYDKRTGYSGYIGTFPITFKKP